MTVRPWWLMLVLAGCAGRAVTGPLARSAELRLAADWDRAAAVVDGALETTRAGDDRLRLLVERSAIAREAHIYRRHDGLARAAASLAEAEPLARDAGPAARAAYLEERGWHEYDRAFAGQATFEQARRWFDEARRLREPLGEPLGLAYAWFEIGLTHEQAAQLAEARRAYQRGLGLAERAGSLVAQGYLQRHLGSVESDLAKDPAVAVPYLERSLALRERGGHRWGEVFAALTLADVVVAKDPQRARDLYRRAATLAAELEVTRGLAAAHEALAGLDAACRHLTEAAQAWTRYGDGERAAEVERRRAAACVTP